MKIIYRLIHFKEFIIRLYKWIPVLWEQTDTTYEDLYDLIEFKLKELKKYLKEDSVYVGSDKRAKEISICLAYLDRYRNWHDYIDYPTDDMEFVPAENDCYELISTNKRNKLKRKAVFSYEKFNYDMFWKRFLKWHKKWWC